MCSCCNIVVTCLLVLLSICAPTSSTLTWTQSLEVLPYGATRNFSQLRLYKIEKIENLAYACSCVKIDIKSDTGNFELFFSDSLSDIANNKPTFSTIWKLSKLFYSQKQKFGVTKTHCFSPFSDIFVRVEPDERSQKLSIEVRHRLVDFTCMVCLLSGLLLFISAKRLSQSATFYYSSSTGIGILASALILVFILSKIVPGRKPITYSILFGGWTFCGVLFNRIKNNLIDVIVNHYYLALGYVLVTGFLGFAACYRFRAFTDPRSRQVLQWSMQLISLVLVYNGTQLAKISVSIISLLLIHSLLSKLRYEAAKGSAVFSKASVTKRMWKWVSGGETHRFLTQDEYRLQGELETKKALAELRAFCHSPKCSPWKTLSVLQSPNRFSKFVAGDQSHVLDSEREVYDADMSFLGDGDGLLEQRREAEDFDDSLISEDDDDINRNLHDQFMTSDEDDNVVKGRSLNGFFNRRR